MSSHNGNNSSSDDDEDFGPVLSSTQLRAQPAPELSAASLDNNSRRRGSPPLKRERHGEQAADAIPAHPDSLPSESSPKLASEKSTTELTPTTGSVKEESAQKEAWECYTLQHLPHAPLYERSFQHTSLQATYDALAAAAAKDADASPMEAVVSVRATAVHDICVHYDALGALIATVDATGVVRMWRKLPRGVFFITELDKIFLNGRKANPNNNTNEKNHHQREVEMIGVPRYHRTYWAHAYSALQLLVFVCVEEEIIEAGDLMQEVETNGEATRLPPPRTVRVHLRQVNPVTFTIEERHTFSFQAPVQPVARVDMTEGVQNSPATAPQETSLFPCALAYTRRPVFLIHRYTPHIAFFVSLPAATSTGGGNGVVISPCFPTSQFGKHSTLSRGTDADSGLMYAATRLSVANAIVQCVQQPSEVERIGTAPCVLLDATGVLDYCTIEATADAGSEASSSAPFSMTTSGLTLKVIAGLAAVPAASREARVWRQWIRFDRRQRTGFFSLIRDAQHALKQQQQQGSAVTSTSTTSTSPADVQLIPGALQLTPNGKYVVVWSLRLIRTPNTAMMTASACHSRTPSTERTYHITVESCLHILEFSTGACVGKHFETLEEDGATVVVTSVEDIGFPSSESVDYVRFRSRTLALQMHVEESLVSTKSSPSLAKARYYVMVPEVSCARLLGGNAFFGEIEAAPAAAQVCGRRIRVYEVTLSDDTLASPAVVRRLGHGPGELESWVRQGKNLSWVGGNEQGEVVAPVLSSPPALHLRLTSFEDALQRLVEAKGAQHSSGRRGDSVHVVCRSPLLLLRRTVEPSQDLKTLIAASPLGAALGAESRKQLFLVNTTAENDAAEGLLLTTSMEAGATSLLVYSCELPYSGLALQRFLLRPTRTQLALADEDSAGEHHGETNAGPQRQRQLRHRWENLCQELHRERDYACGALLMTAVAPPPGETAVNNTAAATGVPPTASSNDLTEEEHKEKIAGQEKEEQTSTVASRPTTAALPISHVKQDSPEAYIVNLLKDVVPQLSSATTKLPVALVHVRGYGTIRVHLLPPIAPLASENFIRLSRRHYYDRFTFHRVIPHAIVQGGCPHGDGTGGESAFDGGAPFQDEALYLFPFFSHTMEMKCCWLCMANAGPNTNGSQFFFTVPGGEAMPWLNGHHTVFGFAVDGLDVVRAISLAARDEADKPLSPIVMERVDILSG